MKHHSHNSIAGFAGLLCVNHGIDFMQIITFGWMLGCRGWGRKGGQLRKNQKGEERKACCSPSLCCNDHSWTPRTLPRKRGKPLLLPSCLKGAPDIYLPNRAFYFPGLVGTELLEGRRMEDCGCTLGIKINLIFVETTTCLQPWRNVIGTFWLRKMYWFVCQLACCGTFPKEMQFGF